MPNPVTTYILIFILLIFIRSVDASVSDPDSSYVGFELLNDHDLYVVDSIALKGNGVTKDFIMFREVVFSDNETYTGALLKEKIIETRENLLNTSLFNFVTMIIETADNPETTGVIITVKVIERWYIWPFPIFELADRNFNAWIKKMDFNRVNYGLYLVWDNFRGRKERVTLLARFGYDEKYNLSYEVPYINKKRTLGIGLIGDYSRNHEIAYQTINDELVFYKSENSYPQEAFSVAVELINRPDIHNSHNFLFTYHKYNIADTIIKLNPQYTPAGRTSFQYFTLYYKFKSDFRDFAAYPLSGYYFDIIAEKYGLGIFDNDLDLFTLQCTFRKYWKFSTRWYFASLVTAQFASKTEVPYVINSGLGFGRFFVRGYEYYVVDGQNFGLSRSNIKFAILPTKVYNINFIRTEKFSKIHFAMYLNLFFDMGFVEDKIFYKDNTLSNTFLYGTGLGLDLVTYYDVIIRLEYTMNKLKETGFFIHFMAPI